MTKPKSVTKSKKPAVKLKKPTKKYEKKGYYNFNEVMHYLEQLHGKNFRNYAGRTFDTGPGRDLPYQDFWHWCCDHGDIHNGSWFHMPEGYEDDPHTEAWVKEIIGFFRAFLGRDYTQKMWLEW